MKICAIDIGTSRIKAALFTPEGEMTLLKSRRLDRASSPDTQDACVWYHSAASLLKEITETDTPEGVVLTGNMHALLGIDRHGIPVENAVLWSDNSARKESDFLNEKYGKYLWEHFGNSSIPVFTLPKLLKMKRERQDLYCCTEKFLQSKDYVIFRLTGKHVTDPTDASGTLLMDYETGNWSERLTAGLGIDRGKLPEIMPSASVCGRISSAAAAETGLQEGTPVITGCGDLSSAALGSGVKFGTFSLTLGTAGQLLAAGKNAGKDLAGKIFVFAHAEPSLELYLGSVPSGGFSFEWLARLLNISMEDFFRLAAETPLKKDLPLFMPYILGRGAPYMDYESKGAWFRLRADHTPGDLCRGAVFGALAALKESALLLEKLGVPGKNLILQALACREKAVTETACALFPQKKYIPESTEASLLGAAIVGWTALGAYRSIGEGCARMVRKKEVQEVPPEVADAAQSLYVDFLKYKDRV